MLFCSLGQYFSCKFERYYKENIVQFISNRLVKTSFFWEAEDIFCLHLLRISDFFQLVIFLCFFILVGFSGLVACFSGSIYRWLFVLHLFDCFLEYHLSFLFWYKVGLPSMDDF